MFTGSPADMAIIRREIAEMRAAIKEMMQPPRDPYPAPAPYPAWMRTHEPKYGKARKKVRA